MPKPLIVQAPYPTTEGICPDVCALKIISPAYATSTGELNAILQYVYHSFIFSAKGRGSQAETLMSIAIAEMHHLDLLGETICALGAQPIFTAQPPSAFNFYSAKFVNYSCNLRNMIEDDIMGEKHAIYAYERMLCKLKNEKVSAIIARILEDEKLHLSILREILQDIC
ncbi:MAG: ferritin-like domain-containing protein [Candidatus Coproplasma sp.]